MEVLGFYFTVAGTLTGIISLIITILINIKTTNIQKQIKYFEKKTTFKIKKEAIESKINLIYDKNKAKNEVDLIGIREVTMDLKQFDSLLSQKLYNKINEIEKIQKNTEKRKLSKKDIGEIMELIYEIKKILEYDFEVLNENLNEV